MELAERLHYPIGRAAALEAQGVCADDPLTGRAAAVGGRRRLGASWTARSRPPAARLLAGQVLVAADADRGRAMLVAAAEEIEALGVAHLSERARTLATG